MASFVSASSQYHGATQRRDRVSSLRVYSSRKPQSRAVRTAQINLTSTCVCPTVTEHPSCLVNRSFTKASVFPSTRSGLRGVRANNTSLRCTIIKTWDTRNIFFHFFFPSQVYTARVESTPSFLLQRSCRYVPAGGASPANDMPWARPVSAANSASPPCTPINRLRTRCRPKMRTSWRQADSRTSKSVTRTQPDIITSAVPENAPAAVRGCMRVQRGFGVSYKSILKPIRLPSETAKRRAMVGQ